jgi:DNA-binding response OmpR family regulator
MLARITALGRRSQALVDENAVEFGEFSVDVTAHTIMREGVSIELTHKEFELALFLFRNIGRLLSRSHILESVWGQSAQLNTRTVDTHISRIRNKLDLVPERGWRLSGVYHHGYRLERHNSAESQVS